MKILTKNRFLIKRYTGLMSFANWLQNIPSKVTPPPFRLIQIGSAFWQSRALYIATKLEVADEIGDDEKSTTIIAEALNLNEDHLYRLMRMLASIGIFKEVSVRKFINSKLSNYLKKSNPDNVRDMVIMHNSAEMTEPWMSSLEQSMRDGGIPFKKVNGVDLFEYMDKNEDFDILFSKAMDSVENVAGTEFLEDFNWSEFKRVIDVGGSHGSKSLAILKANESLEAVVFDRPQTVQLAREKWKNIDKMTDIERDALNRIKFIGGDMLQSIPEAESDDDVYLFMAIFHTFNDSDCKQILNNLLQAFGSKSPYVVIADAVADEKNIDPIVASFDMQMLMGTKGRERTIAEWKSLFNDTGFIIDQVVDVRAFAKYIVLRRI